MPRWIDDLVGYNQIVAEDGTPLRRRHIVQFVGASVIDDGEKTVVTTSGASANAEFFLGAAEPSLPNARLPVDSISIGWNLVTPNTFTAFVKPGAIPAAHLYREEGVDVAQRDALNVVDTPAIALTLTDDAPNNEVELRATFSAAASLSVLANGSNALAVPTYVQAGGAREHFRVNAAGTALEWGTLQLADFPVIASDTFLANTSIGPSAPVATTFASVAGIGLDWDGTTNQFNVAGVPASSVDVNARTVLCRITGTNGPADMLPILTNGILVRNGSGDLASLQLGSHCVVGRLGSGNPTLISSTNTNQILLRGTGSILFAQINDDEVLGRTGSGVLASSKIVTNMVLDGNITLPKLAPISDDSMLVNIAGVSASPTERTLAAMAGDGLIYDAVSHHWDVNGSTSIIVTSDQVQREALTGVINAALNSNTTTFSGAVAGIGLTLSGGNTVIDWDGLRAEQDGVFLANFTELDFLTSSKIAPTLFSFGSGLGAVEFGIVPASIPTTDFAPIAARTLIANNTNASATPTAVPYGDIYIRPDLLDTFSGGVASTTLPNSVLGWNFRNNAGSGTCARQNSGSIDSDGSYRIGTGGTSNDHVSFTLGDTNTRAVLDPRYFKYTEFIVSLNSIGTTRLQIGYMQDAGVDSGGTDALMFIFDSPTSGNWVVRSRSSNVNTTTTLSTSVGTGRIRLGIATTFFPAEARFYINGGLVATHTTNVPLVTTNIGIRLQTLAAGSKTLDFSRFTALRYNGDRMIPEA